MDSGKPAFEALTNVARAAELDPARADCGFHRKVGNPHPRQGSHWRPITAIRNGDIDGNAATELEATWQPIDVTPLHPEYPCAHCIQSGTAVAVIEAVLGSPDIPEVALTSSTAPGVTHRWTNLGVFAEEVANARIWAGFHYRFSTRVGTEMGRQIGQYVVQHVMQPVAVAGSR